MEKGINEWPGHNISIGHEAGIHLTKEEYQLCLKCDELLIDIVETMSPREYDLVSKAIAVLSYYHEKEKSKMHYCSACRSGNCSIHLGYNNSKINF